MACKSESLLRGRLVPQDMLQQYEEVASWVFLAVREGCVASFSVLKAGLDLLLGARSPASNPHK